MYQSLSINEIKFLDILRDHTDECVRVVEETIFELKISEEIL